MGIGSVRGSLATGALAGLVALGAGCGSSSTPAAAAGGGGGGGGGGGAVVLGTCGVSGDPSNCAYGYAEGLREGWVVDMTTDEAQNRWFATPNALYVATPGGAFHRYDDNDGLHLGAVTGRTPGPGAWVKYCNNVPVAGNAACTGDVAWGGGGQYGIRSLAGGRPNEVFVGYNGDRTAGISCGPVPDGCDPLRHSGKIDRVRLNANGSISVDRFDYWLNWHDLGFWYNRSLYRLVYDHVTHPGTLYGGSDHGVIIVFPDRYVPYSTTVGLDPWLAGFIGDHLHAQVCVHEPCQPDGSGNTIAGFWRGLALDGQGRLWHAGEFTAGLATWDSDPVNWHARGLGAFAQRFGDPYPIGTTTGGFQNEPVFKVPLEGDPVNLTAVSVCPDGRVWFGSEGATAVDDTVAVWDPVARRFQTFDARALGLPDRPVQDLVCMPDGRVAIAGVGAGLVIYDPASGAAKPLTGLPGTHVNRLSVDTLASPFSLLVSTDSGAVVLRKVP